MHIIVGLGNPGKRYEQTRHNIGFLTVDKIAEELGVKIDKIKFQSLVGEASFSGQKIVLVKPQTYMNLSGRAVREIMHFYKLPIENLTVIYDDIDIERGKIRVRKTGSAGTHNGMRDIIYQLQDDRFARIRVGIGTQRRGTLADFVTGGFSKEEIPVLEEAVMRAAKAALAIVSDGIEKAMNEYNVREKKEKLQESEQRKEKSMQEIQRKEEEIGEK